MSTPKIVLHLGLPKTATSSLQHNVFQKLHEEKRINFLGKCLNYDLQTTKLDVINYKGRFIRDGAEGRISINKAREKLASILVVDSINLFSDEGLMVAYPGRDNLTLSKKLKNLSDIFIGYDVSVVVTLRNPVDYLYSLYVELYPDFCIKFRELNSIQKYSEKLVKEPHDILFESFFYGNWLDILDNLFSVSILSYENLSKTDKRTNSTWANLLGITEEEFSEYFNLKKVNVKKKTGKEVKKIKNLKAIEDNLRHATKKLTPIHPVARWIYNSTGLKKALNRRFVSNKYHKYPTGKNLEQLQSVLQTSMQRLESL